MQEPLEVLKSYWGYASFRPQQEEIINAVLEGKDTLALLPTGGGKSICFQVPGLVMEGVTLVISPLIALMKDQVENLQKRNIPAQAIVSGMHPREIDIALDNCAYGNIKFLYVSPERLTTELMRERLKKMKVNLIAVDEAHCVSQWGYDFRPPYLRIAEIREWMPQVPVLALTASATPDVVEDIQDKLEFPRAHVIRQSFARPNLTYVVQEEEDKSQRLLRVLQRLPGSGIVYVRSRKKTEETALFINRNGVKADFYHAGLDTRVRAQKQKNWIDNRCRIIVATNAFGMGIDKPDVRFVLHLDLPDSPEAYFQEAGRGGRDGERSYAILLCTPSDILDLRERTLSGFPEIDFIKRVYLALGNYYQQATGGGLGRTFDFDLADFASRYDLRPRQVFHSLRFLEKEGYIAVSEALHLPARLLFLMGKNELYRYQVANKTTDAFIKLLLRSYSGVFDQYTKINETDLARRADIDRSKVGQLLRFLHKQKVISYLPRNHQPQLTFTRDRVAPDRLVITREHYAERKRITLERMSAVIHYAKAQQGCRSQLLLAYFGEPQSLPCGLCDICLERKKQERNSEFSQKATQSIQQLLGETALSIEEILEQLNINDRERVLGLIRQLIDDQVLVENNGKWRWR